MTDKEKHLHTELAFDLAEPLGDYSVFTVFKGEDDRQFVWLKRTETLDDGQPSGEG